MRETLEDYQSQSSSTGATTQLGALLRAQLEGNKSE
jgi:small subunit ribosomal protein S1